MECRILTSLVGKKEYANCFSFALLSSHLLLPHGEGESGTDQTFNMTPIITSCDIFASDIFFLGEGEFHSQSHLCR